jgi:hypothetical protein
MRLPRKIGVLLLGIWLIATGVLGLVPSLNLAGSGNILALLAIAAGALVILDR